jgi:hypothetical protein
MANDSEYWDPENSHVEDWQPEQGHWKPGDKPPKFSRKEMKKAIEKRVEELAAESKERVNRRYSSR